MIACDKCKTSFHTWTSLLLRTPWHSAAKDHRSWTNYGNSGLGNSIAM